MFPVTAVPIPPRTLPWYAWRRRAKRLARLELIARAEFRIHVNTVPTHGMSFEQAYVAVAHNGTADVVRGLAFVDLAKIGDCEGHTLELSLRLPLDVKL